MARSNTKILDREIEDIDYSTGEIKLTSDDYAAIEEDLGWSVLPPYPRA